MMMVYETGSWNFLLHKEWFMRYLQKQISWLYAVVDVDDDDGLRDGVVDIIVT